MPLETVFLDAGGVFMYPNWWRVSGALAKYGVCDGRVRIHCPADPAHSDSEHLLQVLDLAQLAGRRVLVVRGEGGRELMPDALRGAGAGAFKNRFCAVAQFAGLGVELQNFLARRGVYA